MIIHIHQPWNQRLLVIVDFMKFWTFGVMDICHDGIMNLSIWPKLFLTWAGIFILRMNAFFSIMEWWIICVMNDGVLKYWALWNDGLFVWLMMKWWNFWALWNDEIMDYLFDWMERCDFWALLSQPQIRVSLSRREFESWGLRILGSWSVKYN